MRHVLFSLWLTLWLSSGCLFAADKAGSADTGWSAYGHDPGGTRYSPLKQIDRANVERLRVAWTYHTSALDPVTEANRKAAFEATPILVDGTLYLSTPFNQLIALDPATGAEKWKFDPRVDRTANYSEVSSRGVAAWHDTKASKNAACKLRIFEGTIDARLLALDGNTGNPCADFGDRGQVDLTRDVDVHTRADYEVTSAPTVVGDLVITGSSIGDNRAVNVERGTVRAYDARTGKLRWTWDPIPWAKAAELGSASSQLGFEGARLRTGAANAWSTFAADPERDLIFVPTGSASPDYYGGERPGDNRNADSVVALRASTGQQVWAFQVVHHDLWDYDVPSQPMLITFNQRPAVAVTTKMGNVFVLDRETGKPLMKVEERAVPKSDVPGEESSPTQPFPAWSAMVPQTLTPDDAWGPTPEDRAWCRDKMASLRHDGFFTPPSLKGSLQFPGNAGGVNWGSSAWDPQRNLLLADTNRIAAVVQLIPRDDLGATMRGARDNRMTGEFARQTGTPYGMYREFLMSPAGTPCNPPPWGALVAFDLSSGKLRWETPLGEMNPAFKTAGSVNLGGPMVTAGGVVFSAAAKDTYLRGFDVETGAEVWKAELPAGGQSTPMTYEFNGKQYLVICAGGHGKLDTKMGDSVVAFALP